MKTKLFLAAMAAVAVIGCQKETGAPVHEADGTASFMKVDLRAAGSLTKAATPGTYEYGTTTENQVSSVTFYFFDASGNKFVVQNAENFMSGNVSDWTTNSGTPVDNVEKISGLVLVIKQHQSGDIPAKMVAVLNAPNEMKKSYSTLTALSEDILTSVRNGNDFIMSNSVYSDGNNVVNYTTISGENLFEANVGVGEPGYNAPGTIIPSDDPGYPAASAEGKPVKIYVERVAAKVRLANNPETLIPVKDANGAALKDSEGTPVFVKIDGWDVTNNLAKSTLLKQISATYDENVVDFTWNVPANFRSYWANKVEKTGDPLHNLTLAALTNKEAVKYYHENTAVSADGNSVDADSDTETDSNKWGDTSADGNQAPQLLIAATLVNESGAAIDLAKWYDKYYTQAAAKTAMVATVSHRIYVKVKEGETGYDASVVKYREITPADVKFKQKPQTAGEKRYQVFATELEGITYYDANQNVINYGTANLNEINSAKHILESVEPAQIWNGGRTYYYTDIEHFGSKKGMVRNHCYEINVTAINGFGTPVYDPNVIITPEKPVDSKAVNLSAEINILSWHLVKNDVVLN